MFVVVGLGNPGKEYEGTRHNMGYMTLDILAGRWGIDIKRHRFRAVLGEGMVAGQKVVLAKPATFMNNSGWSVMDIMTWYKCAHSELILIYDDIDLPLGGIRVREGGSAGTHNGMRSVIHQLGYDDFPRVRVGIGGADRSGLISHVLGEPTGEEREMLLHEINSAADAVELILKGTLNEAQVKFNKKPHKENVTKPKDDAAETISTDDNKN
ncbi:MAG: aminoacyl-tRNA hydrolase [Clostridia bacterium]